MEYMEIQGGFLCCECNEGVIFQCIFDLQAHHDVRHSTVRPQRFRCSVCRRFSVDKNVILQHLMDHFQRGRYKCLKCDQTFPCKVDITHHLQQSHKVQMLFYCCKCGESFPSRMNAFKHARSRHNTCSRIHGSLALQLRPASMEYMEIQGGFFCCVCNDGIIFQTTSDLKAHYDGKHPSSHPPQFVCSVCNLKSQSETFMREHVENHFMRRRFVCLECRQTYHDDWDVKLHLREAHGVLTRYSCSLCKDSYPSKLNVLRHAISKHINSFHSGGRALNLVPQSVEQATALNVTCHAESSHNNSSQTEGLAVNPGQDVGQPTALNVTWHGESSHNNLLGTYSPSVNLVPQDIGQTTALNVTWSTETSNNNLLQTQGLAVTAGHGDVEQPTGLNVTWHGESSHNDLLGTYNPSVNLVPQDIGQTTALNVTRDTASSNNNFLQTQDLAVNTGQGDVGQPTGLNLTWHGESCDNNLLGTQSPSVNLVPQDIGQPIRVIVTWDTKSSHNNVLQTQGLTVNTGQQDVGQTTSDVGATAESEAKCTTEDAGDHLPEWGTLEDWLEIMKQDIMSQVEQSNECNASNSIDINLNDFFC